MGAESRMDQQNSIHHLTSANLCLEEYRSEDSVSAQTQCPVIPEKSDYFLSPMHTVTLVEGHMSLWGRLEERVIVCIFDNVAES